MAIFTNTHSVDSIFSNANSVSSTFSDVENQDSLFTDISNSAIVLYDDINITYDQENVNYDGFYFNIWNDVSNTGTNFSDVINIQ